MKLNPNEQSTVFRRIFVVIAGWLDRLKIGVVLFIAAILRIGSIALIRSYLNPHTWEFGPLAESIAGGFGYSDLLRNGTRIPSIYMPPAYPYFLAFFYWMGGEKAITFFIIEVVQAAFGVLLVYVIYKLAALLMGNRAAIAAACMTAIFPTQIYMCNEFHGICIYIVLGTSVVYFLIRYQKLAQSWWDIISAGLLMGGVLLYRGEAPVLAVMYAAILFLQGGMKTIKPAIVFILIAFACLVPWTYRNYKEFGRFIPICASDGINLWIGNNQWANGSDRYFQADIVRAYLLNASEVDKKTEYYDFARIREVENAYKQIPEGKNELVQKNEVLKRLAIQYVEKNPQKVLALALKKLFIFFAFDPNHEKGREPYYWLPSIFLTILAIFGAARRGCKLFKEDILLLASVAFAVVIGMVVMVLPRYKIVIDPFIIVFAANLFSLNSEQGRYVDDL